jgi:sugar-phosphatase
VTADDVQRGKPDPQGYLLAAERLGRDPAACIVFEDAPPGVAAARAAGARVVALTTTHTADALRDTAATIADFRSLRVDREETGLVIRF